MIPLHRIPHALVIVQLNFNLQRLRSFPRAAGKRTVVAMKHDIVVFNGAARLQGATGTWALRGPRTPQVLVLELLGETGGVLLLLLRIGIGVGVLLLLLLGVAVGLLVGCTSVGWVVVGGAHSWG